MCLFICLGPSTAFNKATEKLTNSDVSTTGLNYNFVETDMEFSEKFGEIIDDIDMDELLLEMNNNTPSLTWSRTHRTAHVMQRARNLPTVYFFRLNNFQR